MKFIPFQAADQKDVSVFLRSIFKEMEWKELETDGIDDAIGFFHLPHKGTLILARDKNDLVATAGIVQLKKQRGLIKRFYVSANYRGTGMAQKLLQALYEQAMKMNISRLVLDVSKTNHRAIRFYEKHGFIQYTQEPISGWTESQSPDYFRYYYREL